MNRCFYCSPILFLLYVLPAGVNGAESYQRYKKETGLPALASSLHFTVFARNQSIASKAIDSLEETLEKIMVNLPLKRVLGKHCLVFIWEDEKDYIKRADQYHGGDIETTMGFFIMAQRNEPHKIFFYECNDLFLKILPHELGHLMLEVVLNPLRKYVIPLWLHEGFAQLQEEKDYLQEFIKVKRSNERGRLISLDRLIMLKRYPISFFQNSLFYMESESLVRFLIEEQTREDEFYECCNEFLFWNINPIEAIKNRYGKKFPNMDTIQKNMLAWIRKKTKGVPITPENTFLQPQKRYSMACRHLEKSEKEESEETETILFSLRLAISELSNIQEEDPQWSSVAVKKLLEECIERRDSLKVKLSQVSPDHGETNRWKSFSLKKALTFYEKDILNIFGEPTSSGKIKLSKNGESFASDKYRISYAKFIDCGLKFIFRRKRVIGVSAWAPFEGEYQGVKIGDSREKVLEVLGSRLKRRINSDPYFNVIEDKNCLEMDIAEGRARYYIKDDELTCIELHGKNILGMRSTWVGF